MSFFKAFVAAALLATPCGAALAKKSADAPASADQPKKEKKICRIESGTGSRLSRHAICMTAAEWADEDRIRAREAASSVDSSHDRNGRSVDSRTPM